MNTSHILTTTRMSLRARLIHWLVETTKPYYIRWFKKGLQARLTIGQGWDVTKEQLTQYPSDTLGFQLAAFLKKENLSLMPLLEEHDVMHVLLEYEPTIVDEINMQFFLVGNGKRSLYAYGTAIIGAFLMPEHWGQYRRAYRRGQLALNFSKWDFQYLLKERTDDLRNLIFKKEQHDVPLFI